MAICLDYQAVYTDKRQTQGSLQLHLLAALVLVAALGWRVWLKIELTDVGYKLAKERQRSVELDMRRREVLLELSVLKRPDTLASRASGLLGLRPLQVTQARRVQAAAKGQLHTVVGSSGRAKDSNV